MMYMSFDGAKELLNHTFKKVKLSCFILSYIINFLSNEKCQIVWIYFFHNYIIVLGQNLLFWQYRTFSYMFCSWPYMYCKLDQSLFFFIFSILVVQQNLSKPNSWKKNLCKSDLGNVFNLPKPNIFSQSGSV